MTDELLRIWGKNVRGFRVARKLTQAQLAEKVGVTKPTVSRWEAGLASPRDGHKVAVASALEIDVQAIFPLIRVAS